jgi:hypothetical protein
MPYYGHGEKYKEFQKRLEKMSPEERDRVRKQGRFYCLAYLLFFIVMMGLAIVWGITHPLATAIIYHPPEHQT